MATYMATSMTAASNAAAYYDGRSARTIVYASLSIAADGFRVSGGGVAWHPCAS